MLFVDAENCLRDSPLFRAELGHMLQSSEALGETFHRIGVQARKCYEAEKEAMRANKLLAEQLVSIIHTEGGGNAAGGGGGGSGSGSGSARFEAENTVNAAIARFGQFIEDLEISRELLIAKIGELIVEPTQQFSGGDLQEIKDLKSKFDTTSTEYETELAKYCALSKRRESKDNYAQHQAILLETKKKFLGVSISLTNRLNEWQSMKKHRFLDYMVAYVKSVGNHHQEGYRAFDAMSPLLRELTDQLVEVRNETEKLQEKEKVHQQQLLQSGVQKYQETLDISKLAGGTTIVAENEEKNELANNNNNNSNNNNESAKNYYVEGYLMYKKTTGARRIWIRRYFVLNPDRCCLYYYTRRDLELTLALHLQNTTIREVEYDDRRYVFEVSSPAVHYYLQAETEGELAEWMNALKAVALMEVPEDAVVESRIQPEPLYRKAPIGLSFPRGLSFSLRRNSGSKAPGDSEEESEGDANAGCNVHDLTPFVKSGQLIFKRESKKPMLKTIRNAGNIFAADILPSIDWKPVFATLAVDGRITFYELDNRTGANAKPYHIDKVIAMIDVNKLHRYAVQVVEESILNKRHCFSIAAHSRRYFLSGSSANDRNEWVLAIKNIQSPLDNPTAGVRSLASLTVEVTEGRNLPVSDYFCEIWVDGTKTAVTATKAKTSSPYWSETFVFDDLPELEQGVQVIVKSKPNTALRVPKDETLGFCYVASEVLHLSKRVDKWYALSRGTVSDPKPTQPSKEGDLEVKILTRYQVLDIFPVHKYDNLWLAIQDLNMENFAELAKIAEVLERLANNMLRIFQGKKKVLEWLKYLVGSEIQSTDNINVMFRANSLGTKALDQYMKLVGMSYLDDTIGDAVRTICESKQSCEVDPTRLTKNDDIAANWQRLLKSTTMVWELILKSTSKMPQELRSIFNHIQTIAQGKFGSEQRFSTVRYTSVSGFLFLRFFCPAILTPKFFGIVPEHPDEKTRRTLTLITKTLQCLANLGSFGVKEQFMGQMNEFLMEHSSNMMDFIDEVSNFKEQPAVQEVAIDVSRELAEFQQFCSEKKDKLEKVKSPQMDQLLLVTKEIDSELEKTVNISLDTFLME